MNVSISLLSGFEGRLASHRQAGFISGSAVQLPCYLSKVENGERNFGIRTVAFFKVEGSAFAF